MKLFSSSRYAAVASTAALVVALGGTGYAAAQITSADIKDGTIQTRDMNASAQTTAKQVHNDNYTTLGASKTVLSMNLGPGKYLLDSKVDVYTGSSGYGFCSLTGPSGQLDYGYYYTPGTSGYGQIVDRAALATTSTVTVQLNCSGSNASINQKKLTAIKVDQLANLTGPDVAKTAFRPVVGR